MKSQFRVRVTTVSAAVAFVALLALAGCSSATAPSPATGGSSGTPSGATSSSASASGAVNTQGEQIHTPTYVPNGTEVAVFKTDKGEIRVKLYGTDAPINTGNFIDLALSGFYNGTRFHRLEPGFVLQGGDPQTKKLSKAKVIKLVGQQNAGKYAQGDPMLGTGGPGYVIKGEFDPNNVKHPHIDGTLAMARTDDPDSAGSQFYFALAPLTDLDGKYTVFGDTTQGLDVVHKLAVGDVINSITIENASK
jgi:peptidyl-prolyl cis-trans isomerase B (cyclophilin B)